MTEISKPNAQLLISSSPKELSGSIVGLTSSILRSTGECLLTIVTLARFCWFQVRCGIYDLEVALDPGLLALHVTYHIASVGF